jgi:hypothetical protein
LVEGDLDGSPAALSANFRKAFQGSILLGTGFTFDDVAAAKSEAESLEAMRALIAKDPRNAERIFPYVGGEEVNNDPEHKRDRYVVDFGNFPLRREQSEASWASMTEAERDESLQAGIVPLDYPYSVAADWPDLLELVERRVKPERLKQKDKIGRQIWWRFLRRRDRLYTDIAPLKQVLVRSLTSSHFSCFVFLNNGFVYDQTLIVWAFADARHFSVLSSRVHEVWTLFLGATLKNDGRYSIADCFRTFPIPGTVEADAALNAVGQTYHSFRARIMIERNEGLTRTYNRFHARGEIAPDIAHLRSLHADMDSAVLRAYGWDDLAESAAPEFIEQEADEGKKPRCSRACSPSTPSAPPRNVRLD